MEDLMERGHINMALTYIQDMPDHLIVECFVNPISPEDARHEIQKLRDRGYKWLPFCDNTDDTGLCKGH